MTRLSMRLAVVTGIVGLGLSLGSASPKAQSPEREPVSIAQFDRWMDELSNWGRWGDDDQIGAANLMTDEKRREAAALVRTGTTVSLSHDFLTEEAVDAAEPYVLQMNVNPEGQNSGDRVEVYFHGVTYSHLDGLCHVFYRDKLYNGLDFRDVVTEDGCSLMDTTQMKDGLVTRGVLVDMPRLKGVPYLEPGTKLYREDIEAWEEYAGVRLGPGDALLLRTGRWARRAEFGAGEAMSGWDASVMPWMAERDIALLGADSVHEARHRSRPRVQPHPPLRHRGARHEPAGQPRPGGGGGDGGAAQPVGLHAGDRAAAGAGRHRLASQSAGDILTVGPEPVSGRPRSRRSTAPAAT